MNMLYLTGKSDFVSDAENESVICDDKPFDNFSET